MYNSSKLRNYLVKENTHFNKILIGSFINLYILKYMRVDLLIFLDINKEKNKTS